MKTILARTSKGIFLFILVSIKAAAGRIDLDGYILSVEIADTPKKWNKGLMGREHLEPDHGMLFVFPTTQTLSFWMKNTLIPLSIAFFDESCKLTEIREMPTLKLKENPIPLFQSSLPSRYALEMPEGWFETHKVKPGAKFSFLDQENPLK